MPSKELIEVALRVAALRCDGSGLGELYLNYMVK